MPPMAEMIWMHSENEGERGKDAPRQLSGRGVAYWTDGREERIIYVTPGYRMLAFGRQDRHSGQKFRRQWRGGPQAQ